MISALGGIGRQENVVMSVGPKEVGLYHKGEKVIERKVPLPVKWIKGLTTVQIYQSVAEQLYSLIAYKPCNSSRLFRKVV